MLCVIGWSQGPFLRHSQLLSEWKGAGEDISSPFGEGHGGKDFLSFFGFSLIVILCVYLVRRGLLINDTKPFICRQSA